MSVKVFRTLFISFVIVYAIGVSMTRGVGIPGIHATPTPAPSGVPTPTPTPSPCPADNTTHVSGSGPNERTIIDKVGNITHWKRLMRDENGNPGNCEWIPTEAVAPASSYQQDILSNYDPQTKTGTSLTTATELPLNPPNLPPSAPPPTGSGSGFPS